MAPTTTKTTTKPKAPTFKPPRPRTAKPGKTAVARKRRSNAARRPSLAQSEDVEEGEGEGGDHEDEDDGGDSDDDAMDERSRPSRSSRASDDGQEPVNTEDPPPSIPPALLTKLLYHHFQDAQTKIGVEARGVVGKYMETFVREALARAAFERQSGERGTRGMVGDDFLEVEDLEKLAPQLLLDF